MRRVIRRQIRRKEDGLDLAIDFNADIAVNVGSNRPAEPHAAAEPDRPEEDPAQPPVSDEEGKQP